MKFEKVGREVEVPKATVPPLNIVEGNIFNILTLLLGKIKNEKPEIYTSFTDKITKKLLNETKFIGFDKGNEKLVEMLVQYEHLSDNIELVKLHMTNMIEGFGITEKALWENQKTSFPIADFIPPIINQFYIHIKSLIELLGKEKVIEFYMEFVDRSNEIVNARNQANIHENLEDMRKDHIDWMKTNPYGITPVPTLVNSRI